MARTAIVEKSTYKIKNTYEGTPKTGLSLRKAFGGPFIKNSHEHVQYDETVIGLTVKAQDDGQGGIEVVEDVQTRRDEKLKLMRNQRIPKMAETDQMCNELTVGDRVDTSAVQLYRNQLKDITDSYKDGGDPDMGTAALDALEDDLSDLSWPSAP